MGASASTLHADQSCFGRMRVTLDRHSSKTAAYEIAPWQAQICSFTVKGSTFHFDLEVKRPDGKFAFSVRRTLEQFQCAHNELKDSLKDHDLKDLPDLGAPSEPPSASAEPRAQLQRWLDEVLDAGLLPTCLPLQSFLGLPNSSNLWAAPGTPSLTMLAECHQPLLVEIASYASDSAMDLANLTHLTSRLLSRQVAFAGNSLWGSVFAARWPALHESLDFRAAQDWKENYRCTLSGKREYLLEVFDRERKLGFAMAAMAAKITYDNDMNCFVARYLSASEVLPESIPALEGHRLRFCPPSARAQLQPGTSDSHPASRWRASPAALPFGHARSGSNSLLAAVPISFQAAGPEQGRSSCYPYRVLEGHCDLVVGQGVELQWKMQFGSPFGWWYGHLEQLHRDPDGKLASATITFRHFPSTSRWYRLEVRFGDSDMRPCSFGGFTGGVRAATPGEHERWMRFLPRRPVVF